MVGLYLIAVLAILTRLLFLRNSFFILDCFEG